MVIEKEQRREETGAKSNQGRGPLMAAVKSFGFESKEMSHFDPRVQRHHGGITRGQLYCTPS